MEDSSQIEKFISALEKRICADPSEQYTIEVLVTVLDHHRPSKLGLGVYSDCQHRLHQECQNNDWTGELLDSVVMAHNCAHWHSILSSLGIKPAIIQPQLFAGQIHQIGDTVAQCDRYLSLFKDECAIPRICHDCFKVQILPLNLEALFQVSCLFRDLKLPRDNSRKSMVEMREDVPYPYKAYIYCQSEEEAKQCLGIFRKNLRTFGITNVYSGISHGCSEYGSKYAGWKYAEDGAHRSFRRPASWDESEAKYFAARPKKRRSRSHFNNRGVTIRNLLTFKTWIDYAELIGDKSSKIFRETPSVEIPSHFATQIKNQCQMRIAQLRELEEKVEVQSRGSS